MRAVLFDFDGVLVNSEPLHFRAMRDALTAEGFTIDEEEYWRHLLAHDDRAAIRIALERHGVPYDRSRIEAVTRRKAEAYEAALGRIPFFPGAAELVRALAREVPLAIASGARRVEIEAILQAGGLRDAFTAVVGIDDVSRGKPDPEPYLTAMQRLTGRAPGLQPADCLVIEDSYTGILAGLSAGMKVLAVTNSYPAAKLASAHRVVDSLAGLDSAGLRQLFAA
jgi:HAD superfamily hydrolase (TIGR01509 family)